MDSDIQQSMPTTNTDVQEFHQEAPHSSIPKALWILLSIVIILGLIGGAYYLGTQKNKTVVSNEKTVSISPTNVIITPTAAVTPTPDITANWKSITVGKTNLKYPTNWFTKYYQLNGETDIYNPQKMQSVMQNGGSYVSLPTEYVNIYSVMASSETADQVAKDFQQQWASLHENVSIETKNINGLDFALYTDAGEGSRYNNLAISNGKILIKMNTSMKSLNNNDIENQIVSTLIINQ